MTRWLPFLIFALFIAVIIIGADSGHLNSVLAALDHLPLGDKLGHAGLMGTLALLLNLALRVRTLKLAGRPFLLGSVIIAVFVTLEELSQKWFPARRFELGDLLANYLGIAIAGLVVRHLLNRKTAA